MRTFRQCCTVLDFQSGAVFSAMVVKGGDPYALAVALEAIKFTGRTRLVIVKDQENAVKNLVDVVRESRTHETAVINTPKGSSASAGGIERANYKVEKQIRTLRSRFEENYGERVGLDHKLLPFLVRHCDAEHALSGEVRWENHHMRGFEDDRTLDRWQSLLKLYTSGTPGRLQTCPSWTTEGAKACGWEREWHQTSTTLEHRQECGDKKSDGAKSGTLLDPQKVYDGWLRELGNIEKLYVAEPIQLQEVRAQNLEIVHGEWLDDAKGTSEDPDAVRSRLGATQVNTYAREDVTQATPPIKASRIIVSQAATKTKAKGQHDCLIAIGVLPCERNWASRDHPAKGIGTTRSRWEMRENVVRDKRGEQVLGQ